MAVNMGMNGDPRYGEPSLLSEARPSGTEEAAVEGGRILVVEDHKNIREIINLGLTGLGYEVHSAPEAAQGLSKFLELRPDAVLVDLLLPGMDGFGLCRRLRELSDVPIIIISALRNETQIVNGLDAGADDYVTKPFSIQELSARLRALLRRRGRPGAPATRRIEFDGGRLTVDLEAQRVVRDGTDVHLSPTEFRLLRYLVANAGRVIPHRELISQVWGDDAARLGPYLKIYIGRVRQKIEQEPAKPRLITSRHSTGYVFEEVPARAAHATA
ncbi:MAG: response regulator transcription factor [Chloroflexota bacterium]|nr:response regulator transcription factor [Chloroflexota bacterium]